VRKRYKVSMMIAFTVTNVLVVSDMEKAVLANVKPPNAVFKSKIDGSGDAGVQLNKIDNRAVII
jgi:hypothetical protein